MSTRLRPRRDLVGDRPRRPAEWACLVLGGHQFTDTLGVVNPRTGRAATRGFCSRCGTPGIPRRNP